MRAALACVLLVAVAACGARGECAHGEHETCACSDGRGGAKACGADGRYGACVCTTLVASPPSVPAHPATPVPLPLPAPPPLVPGATPATPESREAAIDAWVRGPLRGRDNDMAHLRAVTITRRDDGTFAIAIRNQFRWTCALDFDAAGRPAAMHRCVSAEPGWYADPSDLAFQCVTTDTDEQCEAPYTLGERRVHMRDPARFRILRPLVPSARAPAPPPPRPNRMPVILI